ncbi:helix-turn-helix domain-containing protein [Mycobacterium servetii]|uniref:Helix-turn-helix domain-containing protein n=1 Tax=Mycobacterium servetii TaxID=3237418 RepID=A0ABV4C151_9MYCO
MSGRRTADERTRIAASVQRIDSVALSLDAARLVVHWLGQLAEITRQRNGCPPEGLVEFQHAIAEELVADSRRREQGGSRPHELVGFEHEQRYMEPAEAATALGVSADTVRWHCRKGNLDGRKFGRQVMVTAASVEALKARRSEQRGA